MTGIKGYIGIALRVLVGLFFLATAVAKLVGMHQMVVEFGEVGFGQWLRYATGIAELIGVALLIRARTVPVGAAILLAVCAGALYAQIAMLHQGVIHVFVAAAAVGWLGWSYGRSNQTLAG